MASLTEFSARINRRCDGVSLMEYLSHCIPEQTLEQWGELVSNGLVCVNGVVACSDLTLKLGERVSYQVEGYREPCVPLNWSVLWENKDLAAVHKPAGLPISRTTRNIEHNLIRLIQNDSPWPDAHLLHRLDKETSGIVLIAKTKALAQHWQPRLGELMNRKIYHAIVDGCPSWDNIAVKCHLATRPDSEIRCQMHVCREDEKGQESRGTFRVLQRFTHYSVVECELDTGRKHQIRAHLAHLGHPIVGDKIYAHQGRYFLKRCSDDLNDKDQDCLGSPHHLLHAHQVYLGADIQTTIVDSNFPDNWNCFR